MDTGRPPDRQVSASGPGDISSSSQTEVPPVGILDDRIPRILIEEALLRLRSLRDDDERFEALETYGHLRVPGK